MTPDLQARIETLARDLDDRLYREIFGSRAKDAAKMGTARIIAQSLTTLAEQIIAEKDAEAAELKAKLSKHQESEFNPDWSMLQATRDSLKEHQGIIRDLLAELTSLRERVRELEGALNLPREQLAMLSRPLKSDTITPEGE